MSSFEQRLALISSSLWNQETRDTPNGSVTTAPTLPGATPGETVVDGDTTSRGRLRGIDTGEVGKIVRDADGNVIKMQATEPGAIPAMQAHSTLLQGGETVDSGRRDIHGRPLIDEKDADGRDVAQLMAEAGLGLTHAFNPSESVGRGGDANYLRGRIEDGELWRDPRLENERRQAEAERKAQPISFDSVRDTRPDPRGTASRAFARGLEMVDSMAGGFTEALGEATGIESVAEYGRQAREYNAAMMQFHRAEVPEVLRAESAGEIGTWAMEKIIENAPNTGLAAGAGLLAAGAAALVSAPVAAAGIGAAALVGYVLNAGDIQGHLKEIDPDTDAGMAALLGGIPAAALDVIPIIGAGKILLAGPAKQMAREAARNAGRRALQGGATQAEALSAAREASKLVLAQAAAKAGRNKFVEAGKDVLKAGAIGMSQEMPTEAGQEFIADVTAKAVFGDKYDVFTEANARKWIEAGLAGGVSGAALGGGAKAGNLGIGAFRAPSSPQTPPPPAPPAPPSPPASTPATPPPPAPPVGPPAAPSPPASSQTTPPPPAPPVGPPAAPNTGAAAPNTGAAAPNTGAAPNPNGTIQLQQGQSVVLPASDPGAAAPRSETTPERQEQLQAFLNRGGPGQTVPESIPSLQAQLANVLDPSVPRTTMSVPASQQREFYGAISEADVARVESVMVSGPEIENTLVISTDPAKLALAEALDGKATPADLDQFVYETPAEQAGKPTEEGVQVVRALNEQGQELSGRVTRPEDVESVKQRLGALTGGTVEVVAPETVINERLNQLDPNQPAAPAHPAGALPDDTQHDLHMAYTELTRNRNVADFTAKDPNNEALQRHLAALRTRHGTPQDTNAEVIAKARKFLEEETLVFGDIRSQTAGQTPEQVKIHQATSDLIDPARVAPEPMRVNGRNFHTVLQAVVAAHFPQDLELEAGQSADSVLSALEQLNAAINTEQRSTPGNTPVTRTIQSLDTLFAMRTKTGGTVAEALQNQNRGVPWLVATLSNLYSQQFAANPEFGEMMLNVRGARLEYRGFTQLGDSKVPLILRRLTTSDRGQGENAVGRALEMAVEALAQGDLPPTEVSNTKFSNTNAAEAFARPHPNVLAAITAIVKQASEQAGVAPPAITHRPEGLSAEDIDAVVTGRLLGRYYEDSQVLFLPSKVMEELAIAADRPAEQDWSIEALEVLAHELGHHVIETSLAEATAGQPQLIEALESDHAAAVQAGHAPHKLGEWLADQVGHWLINALVKSPASQHSLNGLKNATRILLARIGRRIKKLWEFLMAGRRNMTPDSVNQLMAAIVRKPPPAATPQVDPPAPAAEPGLDRAETQQHAAQVEQTAVAKADMARVQELSPAPKSWWDPDGIPGDTTEFAHMDVKGRIDAMLKSLQTMSAPSAALDWFPTITRNVESLLTALAGRKLDIDHAHEQVQEVIQWAQDVLVYDAGQPSLAAYLNATDVQDPAARVLVKQKRAVIEETLRDAAHQPFRLWLSERRAEVSEALAAQKEAEKVQAPVSGRVRYLKDREFQPTTREYTPDYAATPGSTAASVAPPAAPPAAPVAQPPTDLPIEAKGWHVLRKVMWNLRQALDELDNRTRLSKAQRPLALQQGPLMSESMDQIRQAVKTSIEALAHTINMSLTERQYFTRGEFYNDILRIQADLQARGVEEMPAINDLLKYFDQDGWADMHRLEGVRDELAQSRIEERATLSDWRRLRRLVAKQTAMDAKRKMRRASKDRKWLITKMNRAEDAYRNQHRASAQIRNQMFDLEHELITTSFLAIEEMRTTGQMVSWFKPGILDGTGIPGALNQSPAELAVDEQLSLDFTESAELEDGAEMLASGAVILADQENSNQESPVHGIWRDDDLQDGIDQDMAYVDYLMNDLALGVLSATELREQAEMRQRVQASEEGSFYTDLLAETPPDALVTRWQRMLEERFTPGDDVVWYLGFNATVGREVHQSGKFGERPEFREGATGWASREDALARKKALLDEHPGTLFLVMALNGRWVIAERTSGSTLESSIRRAFSAGKKESAASAMPIEVYSRRSGRYYSARISLKALMRVIFSDTKNAQETLGFARFFEALNIAYGALESATTTDAEGQVVPRYILPPALFERGLTEVLAEDGQPAIVGEFEGSLVALGAREGALNALEIDSDRVKAAKVRLSELKAAKEALNANLDLAEAALAAHPATVAERMIGALEMHLTQLRRLPAHQQEAGIVRAEQALRELEQASGHGLTFEDIFNKFTSTTQIITAPDGSKQRRGVSYEAGISLPGMLRHILETHALPSAAREEYAQALGLMEALAEQITTLMGRAASPEVRRQLDALVAQMEAPRNVIRFIDAQHGSFHLLRDLHAGSLKRVSDADGGSWSKWDYSNARYELTGKFWATHPLMRKTLGRSRALGNVNEVLAELGVLETVNGQTRLTAKAQETQRQMAAENESMATLEDMLLGWGILVLENGMLQVAKQGQGLARFNALLRSGSVSAAVRARVRQEMPPRKDAQGADLPYTIDDIPSDLLAAPQESVPLSAYAVRKILDRWAEEAAVLIQDQGGETRAGFTGSDEITHYTNEERDNTVALDSAEARASNEFANRLPAPEPAKKTPAPARRGLDDFVGGFKGVVQTYSSSQTIQWAKEAVTDILRTLGLKNRIRLVDEDGIIEIKRQLLERHLAMKHNPKVGEAQEMLAYRTMLDRIERAETEFRGKGGWIIYNDDLPYAWMRVPVIFLSHTQFGGLSRQAFMAKAVARVLGHELGHLLTRTVLSKHPELKAQIMKDLTGKQGYTDSELIADQFPRYLIKQGMKVSQDKAQRGRTSNKWAEFVEEAAGWLQKLWRVLVSKLGLSESYEQFIDALSGMDTRATSKAIIAQARQTQDTQGLGTLEQRTGGLLDDNPIMEPFHVELDSAARLLWDWSGQKLTRLNQALLNAPRAGIYVNVVEQAAIETKNIFARAWSVLFSSLGTRVHEIAQNSNSKAAAFLRDTFSRHYDVETPNGHRTMAERIAATMGLFADDFASLYELAAKDNPETWLGQWAWWRGQRGPKEVHGVFERGGVTPIAEFATRREAWAKQAELHRQNPGKQYSRRAIHSKAFRDQADLLLAQVDLAELRRREALNPGEYTLAIKVLELMAKVYDTAVGTTGNGLGMALKGARNRIPLVWDTGTIQQARQGLIEALESDAGFTTAEANRFLDKIQESDGVMLGLDNQVYTDSLSTVLTAKLLTEMAGNAKLQEKLRPYLVNDLVGLAFHFTGALVKRGVSDQIFGEMSGKRFNPVGKLQRLIHEDGVALSEDDKRFMLDQVYPMVMGRYQMAQFSPVARRFTSVVMVYQNVRLLGLATLSSLVDVGVLANRAGMGTFLTATRDLAKGIDRKELALALRSLGIVADDITDHVLSDAMSAQYLTLDARKWSEAFFRLIGLTQWTRLTRVWAGATVVQYFKDLQVRLKAGQPRAARELREMQITRDQLERWLASGSDTVGLLKTAELGGVHDAMGASIAKFINEAVLRPNTGDRPGWANIPMLGLIWHLKQFMWLFHYRVMNRVWHEMKAADNPGLYRALPAIMLAAFLLPLAFLGYLLRKLLTGDLDRFSKMDSEQLSFELIQRAGLPGLMQLFIDMDASADRRKLALLAAAGPTIEQIGGLFTEDPTRWLLRATPGVSNSPWARRELHELMK